MLYRAHTLLGKHLQAVDGAIGKVEDLYFDDVAWQVRYLVVDTGGWLGGREVLVTPEAISGVDEHGAFETKLTRAQVEDSPAASTAPPVSRQYEERLHAYFGWYPYWSSPIYPAPGTYAYPPPDAVAYPPPFPPGDSSVAEQERPTRLEEQNNPDLRSFSEVKGYGLRATDGDIGVLDDLLIEPESWRVTHLIADARTWWFGGEVVIDKGMVQNVSWGERKIVVAMTRDEIKRAPSYDARAGVSETYQRWISDYYQHLGGSGRHGAMSAGSAPQHGL